MSPGDSLEKAHAFLIHEGRRANGSLYRFSALYVLAIPARGLPARVALEYLFHASLAIFRSYSSSGCTRSSGPRSANRR